MKAEDVKDSGQGSSGNAKAVPLGLGLGSLERKVKYFCFLFYL